MASLLEQFGQIKSQVATTSNSPIVNHIQKWIEKRIEMSRKILMDAGRVASRRLMDGLQPLPTDIDEQGRLIFTVVAESYWDFVNKGTNGWEVNNGSPYSIRDNEPTIPNLQMWIAEKGINKLEYVDKAGRFISEPLSSREDYENMAYLIKRNLMRKGVVGVPFIDDVFNEKAIDELVLELQDLF
jgi:hypothetical protein